MNKTVGKRALCGLAAVLLAGNPIIASAQPSTIDHIEILGAPSASISAEIKYLFEKGDMNFNCTRVDGHDGFSCKKITVFCMRRLALTEPDHLNGVTEKLVVNMHLLMFTGGSWGEGQRGVMLKRTSAGWQDSDVTDNISDKCTSEFGAFE